MSLDKLKKDIQNRDSQAMKREHDVTVYNEWQSKEVHKSKSQWQRVADKMQGTRVKAIVTGGIIIAVIAFLLLAAASFVYYQGKFFANERVSLSMDAPRTAQSNELTEIVFHYKNDNRAKLQQSEIIVRFGDYFVPADNQEGFTRVSASQGVINIGSIRGGKKGRFTLVGHFTGPKDFAANISATLRYVPEDASVQYDTNAQTATIITASPVSVDIDSPQEIVSGNMLDMAVRVQNLSADQLSHVKIVMSVPKAFTLHTAEPRFSRKFVWIVDGMNPHEEKVFHVRGGIDAAIGSVQKFRVEVGTEEKNRDYVKYAQTAYMPRIIQSPIVVRQKIDTLYDGVVYAGESVNYQVMFKNDSEVALRDAIVTLHLEGDVIDLTTLEIGNGGYYDQEHHRIIWKAADVPQLHLLHPQDSGEVSLSFSVKSQLPVQTQNDHHFSITSIAAIDSADIPAQLRENKTVLSNAQSIPVGAKVALHTQTKYHSGAQPPKVGEKTVYTVTMKIDSVNNDISDAVVSIPLPTHMKFESSDDKHIVHNDRTNDVMWNAGTIMHGAGITTASKETSFVVSIVPSIDHANKVPILIKKQTLNAVDVFTHMKIVEEVDSKSVASDGRHGAEGLVVP